MPRKPVERSSSNGEYTQKLVIRRVAAVGEQLISIFQYISVAKSTNNLKIIRFLCAYNLNERLTEKKEPTRKRRREKRAVFGRILQFVERIK